MLGLSTQEASSNTDQPRPPTLPSCLPAAAAAAAAVRDSNRPTLLALYRRLLGGNDGTRVVDLGIVRDIDGAAALGAALARGLER